MKLFILAFTIASLTTSAWSGLIFNAINYGAADANEQAAFDAINDFRADPQNELFEMFQGTFSGDKTAFDALLNGTGSHTSNWWKTTFGSNLATNSMDGSGTVPATLNAQFAALPSSVPAYTWNDNIGWAAHQYANWVEQDGGATSNPHAVAGAPTLGARFTNAGVNWSNVGENIAANWPLDVPLMHMGFGIDWGPGVDGIQDPAGHRNSMLSTTFESIGIGILDTGWTGGSYTQVQHFAKEFAGMSSDPIFYGYLFDASGSTGIAGSAVELFNASGTSLGSTTTDAQGAYTIGYTGGTPDYATYMTSGGLMSSQGLASLGNSGSNYFMTAAIPEPSGMVLAAVVVLGVGLRRQRPNRRSC